MGTIRTLPPPPVRRFKGARGSYLKSLTPLDPNISAVRLPGTITCEETTRDALGRKVTREFEVPNTLATATDNDILTAGKLLGVEGLDPNGGRIKNAGAYARHICRLGEVAALAAIDEFIAKGEQQ